MQGSMLRLTRTVLLAAAVVLAGYLVTACAQGAHGPDIAFSPSAGALATPTAQPSSAPTAASPTAVPTTASPTAAPSTAPATPTPTPSSSPTSTSRSGADLIWLWVILGALVLLGIILLATRSPARAPSSPAAPGWHSRAADVYAKGAAFDGAVRAAEREGVLAEAASVQRADLQRRADDLTEALFAIREIAPTEHRRVQVENAIFSLRAVRDAMDEQRPPGVASPQQGGVLHSRLSVLESSLNALRVPDDRLA